MESAPNSNNAAVIREMLRLAERGLRVPPQAVVFMLGEDLVDLPCRIPALLVIDCLIAMEITGDLIAELCGRHSPPLSNFAEK
jgi:hypothetical protein